MRLQQTAIIDRGTGKKSVAVNGNGKACERAVSVSRRASIGWPASAGLLLAPCVYAVPVNRRAAQSLIKFLDGY